MDNHPKSAFERDDIANIGGVARRKVFALTYLLDISCRDLYGQRNRPFSILAVDLIDNLLQTVVTLPVALVEKRLLHLGIRADGEADDPRTLEGIARTKILSEMTDDKADELSRIARCSRQRNRTMEDKDRLIDAKTGGLGKIDNLLADRVLLP